jgi:exodeoxyribonuclease V alpha subunit
VSTHFAVKIWKTYGAEAIARVKENPYRLAADIWGIGFKTADKIAGALGIPKDATQRIEASLLYVLGQGADRGHLYLPAKPLFAEAEELLGVEEPALEPALAALAGREEVIVEPLLRDDERAVYLRSLHVAEAGVAARLHELLRQPPLPLELDSWTARSPGSRSASGSRSPASSARRSRPD